MAFEVEGQALSLLVVTLVFLILSWIVVAMRVWARIYIKGFGLDDHFMIAGLALFTVCAVTTSLSCFSGVGTHADKLDPQTMIQGKKWFTFFQLFYALSTIAIKCAICLALLRIVNRPIYQYPLYFCMFLATLSTTIGFFTILLWCRPISANWDPSTGTCANPNIVTNMSFFISASGILTDWTCAILPVFVLWEIQLNRRTKITVIFILALGVVASISTIVRLKFLLNYNNPNDYLFGVANIALWSIIEIGSGLIAGSMATLRPLLRFVPFMASSRNRSTNNPSSGRVGGPSGYGNSRSYKLDTFKNSGAGVGHPNSRYRTLNESSNKTLNEEERNIDDGDGDSGRHILKETEVTITSDEVLTNSAPHTGHNVTAYASNPMDEPDNLPGVVFDPERGHHHHVHNNFR